MFIFGGQKANYLKKTLFNDINKIDLYNHNNLVWRKVETKGMKPKPRYGHIMQQKGVQLILFGGNTIENNLK